MLRPFIQKLILSTNFALLLLFLNPPTFFDEIFLLYQDFKVSSINRLKNTVYLDQLVLVEIDDESLSRIPDKYPFSRRFLAHVIKQLSNSGAKVIAIGEYFQARSNIDLEQDILLAQAINDSGNVVSRNQLLRFQNHRGQEKWQLTPPIPEIVTEVHSLGFSRGIPNSTNTIRKWLMYHRLEGKIYESLILKALKLYSINNDSISLDFNNKQYVFHNNNNKPKVLDREYSFEILNQIDINNYFAELVPFERLSFVDIFEGKFDKKSIQNKIVLIGTSAQGIAEPIQTNQSLMMSPIELEAHVFSSILQDNHSIETPRWIVGLLLSLVFLLSVWATLRFDPMIYIKFLFIMSPIILLVDGILFLIPSLQLHSNLPIPSLYLFSTALSILCLNYFIESSEKSNIRHAFSHYVTSSVVNQIIRDPNRLKLGGERKELSVFFSDIEGFASISERMEIEKLVKLLNEYLTAMTDNIILDHKGMLDKYEGDAIMAIFGAPMDITDHAYQACLAALDNQNLLYNKLYPRWKKQRLPCFKVRIGINTGTMLVGNMGSRSRFDYTVIGDNVNVGSRLENLNKIYGTNILISDTTRAHIGDRLVVRKLDRVIVRGKSLTMEIYELIGLPDQVSQLHREFIKKYESALDSYFNKDFSVALSLFEQASQMNLVHDKTCNIFIDRCKHYTSNESPAEDWDGVFSREPKG